MISNDISNDYPINALPRGYRIENYQIQDVLGVGGFGITYLAEDVRLKTLVAIKEYLPADLAVRGTHTLDPSKPLNPRYIALHPKSKADEDDYLWGLERFIEEARTVVNLKHPNIVQVKYFFEANNTAYFVMDYEKGESLNKLLKPGQPVEESEIYKLIMPLLNGLKKVHSENYLHRDISPSNIYIQSHEENPILIDFGAARQSLGQKSKSISTIVKIGYAPYEQYQTRGNQGAWSDIYAMGAVLYQLISGSIPIESTERINAIVNDLPDPLPAALKIGRRKYSKKLLYAIDWALQVREKDRPQNIDEWIEALNNEEERTKPPPKGKFILFVMLAIFSLISIAGVLLYLKQRDTAEKVTVQNNQESERKNDQKTTPVISSLPSIEKETATPLSYQYLHCVGEGKKNCGQFK